jgi:hypothetical protein
MCAGDRRRAEPHCSAPERRLNEIPHANGGEMGSQQNVPQFGSIRG